MGTEAIQVVGPVVPETKLARRLFSGDSSQRWGLVPRSSSTSWPPVCSLSLKGEARPRLPCTSPAIPAAAVHRWRELYQAAVRERDKARRIMDNPRTPKAGYRTAEQRERCEGRRKGLKHRLLLARRPSSTFCERDI